MKIFGLMTVKEHERILRRRLIDHNLKTFSRGFQKGAESRQPIVEKYVQLAAELRTDAVKWRAHREKDIQRKRDARKAAKVAK